MLRIQKYDPTTLKQEWSTAFVLLHFSPNRKKILFFLKDDTTATSLNTMNAQLTTTGSNPLLDPVPGNRIEADPPQSLEDATKWAPSVDSTIKKYFWTLSSHCSFDHIKYLLIPVFFRCFVLPHVCSFRNSSYAYRESEPYPRELGKLALATLFLFCGFLLTTASLSVVHEIYPNSKPLPGNNQWVHFYCEKQFVSR